MDFVTGELIFTLAIVTLLAVVLFGAWSFVKTRRKLKEPGKDEHALERRVEADAAADRRRRAVQVEEPRHEPAPGTAKTTHVNRP